MDNQKKRESRLFIISNATHYNNLRTYIESHNNGINSVIFINRFSKGYLDLINRIVKDPDLQLLEIINQKRNINFPQSYLHLFKIIYKVLMLKNVGGVFDKIIFSNYLSWVQHFIMKQFLSKKYILLNDGTAIFETVDLRMKGQTINFPHLNVFVSRYLGSNKIDNLIFYSPIDIEVAPSDSLELFKFPASDSQSVNKDFLYFVGGPLVNIGYISLDNHLSYLKQIKNNFPNHQILYFAHRGEKDKHLRQYEFFGEIIRDTLTFEQRLKQASELPGLVMSYMSSILINLPQIYPQIRFEYYELDFQKIPENSKFRKIYPELLNNFRRLNSQNFGKFKLSGETQNID